MIKDRLFVNDDKAEFLDIGNRQQLKLGLILVALCSLTQFSILPRLA